MYLSWDWVFSALQIICCIPIAFTFICVPHCHHCSVTVNIFLSWLKEYWHSLSVIGCLVLFPGSSFSINPHLSSLFSSLLYCGVHLFYPGWVVIGAHPILFASHPLSLPWCGIELWRRSPCWQNQLDRQSCVCLPQDLALPYIVMVTKAPARGRAQKGTGRRGKRGWRMKEIWGRWRRGETLTVKMQEGRGRKERRN